MHLKLTNFRIDLKAGEIEKCAKKIYYRTMAKRREIKKRMAVESVSQEDTKKNNNAPLF